MLVLIDNYDSFVHNLARYLRLGGAKNITILRNDKITISEVAALRPYALVLSPGPGRPESAGICVEAVQVFGSTTPVLGVCLGHQAIAVAYDGRVKRALEPLHGRASNIIHEKDALFAGVPSPFVAGRYHSLIATSSSVLKVCARSASGEVMSLRHVSYPVWGVQFHPESLLTPEGFRIVENFLALADKFQAHRNQTSPPLYAVNVERCEVR